MVGSVENRALKAIKIVLWVLFGILSTLTALIILAIATPLVIHYFEIPSQKEIWSQKTLGEGFAELMREDLQNVAYPENLSDYSHLFRCGICKHKGNDQEVDCNRFYSIVIAKGQIPRKAANLDWHWRNFKLAFVANLKYDTETNERIFYAVKNLEYWCNSLIGKKCSKLNEEETLKIISFYYYGMSGLKLERVKRIKERIYRGCFLSENK